MLALRWAKSAVVYFVIGVGIGLYMSLAQLHVFGGLHAHVNLLGWVSMALIAGYCRAFPAMEQQKLATVQFWLYQLALPLMMLGLFFSPLARLLGDAATAEAVRIVAIIGVALGGPLVTVSVVLFAIVALRVLKQARAETAKQAA